jgi:hypothetical protein
LADPPILFIKARGKSNDPLDQVSLLHQQFLHLVDGFGTLPSSLKASLPLCDLHYFLLTSAQELIVLKLSNIEFLYDVHFDAISHNPTDETQRLWETVQDIRENARRRHEDGDTEAGWSDMVYSM